jgi:hypothetical protein
MRDGLLSPTFCAWIDVMSFLDFGTVESAVKILLSRDIRSVDYYIVPRDSLHHISYH